MTEPVTTQTEYLITYYLDLAADALNLIEQPSTNQQIKLEAVPITLAYIAIRAAALHLKEYQNQQVNNQVNQ